MRGQTRFAVQHTTRDTTDHERRTDEALAQTIEQIRTAWSGGGSERSEPRLDRTSNKARTRSQTAATDKARKDIYGTPGGWVATFYPNAGEAVVYYQRPSHPEPMLPPSPGELPGLPPRLDASAQLVRSLTGAGLTPAVAAADGLRVRREWEARHRRTQAVRKAQDHKRNAARAAKGVRIYCKEHKIGHMWTNTCRPSQRTRSITRANQMMKNFIDRLKDAQNAGEIPKFPFILVMERHKSGFFHFHMGVPRFVKYQAMNPIWGHGSTQSPRLATRGGGRPTIADLAGYLAKYVSKTFAPGAGVTPKGMHRYHCARGFRAGARGPFVVSYSPEKWQHACSNKAMALEMVLAEGLKRGWLPPTFWYSDEDEEWRGPPCVVLNFTPGRMVFNQDRQPLIRLKGRESFSGANRRGAGVPA